jgi:hypothetical protein
MRTQRLRAGLAIFAPPVVAEIVDKGGIGSR